MEFRNIIILGLFCCGFTVVSSEDAKPANTTICRGKPNGIIAFPDCNTKFYQCTNNLAYVQPCPPAPNGLHLVFVPSKGQCEFGEPAGNSCGSTVVTPPPTQAPTTQAPTTTPKPVTPKPTTPKPTTPKPTIPIRPKPPCMNVSKFECKKEGLFPDPSDETKFYECDYNKCGTDFTCPPKSKFSSKKKTCVKEGKKSNKN